MQVLSVPSGKVLTGKFRGEEYVPERGKELVVYVNGSYPEFPQKILHGNLGRALLLAALWAKNRFGRDFCLTVRTQNFFLPLFLHA